MVFEGFERVFQLRVELNGIRPPIWRRLVMPENANMQDLHYAIQDAMGWQNSHLHLFAAGKRAIDDPRMHYEPEDDEHEDEIRVKLPDVFTRKGASAVYEYDFGDDWKHTVTLEDITAPAPDVLYPTITAGERACPPEDCGGVYGYQELVAALRDPSHPEHGTYRTWAGTGYDPDAFHLELRRSAVSRQECRVLTERNMRCNPMPG